MESSGNKNVRLTIAGTEEEKKKCYRFRYSIYCYECGFIPENPETMEFDIFDQGAVHFMACDEDGKVVATSRAVKYSPSAGLPLQESSPEAIHQVKRLNFDLERTYEFSRIIVAKDHRRGYGKKAYGPGSQEKMPELVLRIMTKVIWTIEWLGGECIVFQIEPKFYKTCKEYGWTYAFQPLGDEVSYKGTRRPYCFRIRDLLEKTREKNPSVYSYMLGRKKEDDREAEEKLSHAGPRKNNELKFYVSSL